ncbi:MAG: PLP-dependent aspartate aminotransferase family protein [Anaerolineae bacterium]|nr:PLP-dependent aspartate aminotransferase family protein [Anaerolineae bacterium]NUQ04991.1 PLP-dependent transferase [Anaerolineae bacterium]
MSHDTPNDCPPARGDSTRAVHGAGAAQNPYGSITTPIIQSATFTFASTADLIAYLKRKAAGGAVDYEEYARFGSPTVDAVEKKLAALEGGGDALLYPSGMAALTSVLLTVLRPETHLIITDDCYRHTLEFCLNFLKKYQIETTVVPFNDMAALEAAVIPKKTRLVISESPTNPYLRVTDLDALVRTAKKHRLLTLIDSTFATPINQRPLAFGIDFVVHSATKYLAGHNDLLAGVVIGRKDRIAALRDSRLLLGGIVDPQPAYLLERGMKTVALRVAQHNASAQRIAEHLEGHPAVERVWYPGLPSHPDHAIAAAQMRGYGGVVTFEVRGDLEATAGFIDRLKLPRLAASLGGVESLIQQPTIMSHFDKSPEERAALGIKDNLVRFSVGIEDADDLIADLDAALQPLSAARSIPS